MRILNDEEIQALDFSYEFTKPYTSGDVDKHYRHVIVKAQYQQDLKDFIEFVEKNWQAYDREKLEYLKQLVEVSDG